MSVYDPRDTKGGHQFNDHKDPGFKGSERAFVSLCPVCQRSRSQVPSCTDHRCPYNPAPRQPVVTATSNASTLYIQAIDFKHNEVMARLDRIEALLRLLLNDPETLTGDGDDCIL